MRAAVPRYVGLDFTGCPPGHRFGLYFQVWGNDWSLERAGKGAALKETLNLPDESLAQLEALRRRQSLLLDAYPESERLSIEARSTAPFATGLGLEHPLENGFAFLDPYGLAYLPGSSVKGVLRRAAEELVNASTEADRPCWTPEAITALFGLESKDRQKEHWRGALTFWDVLPKPAGNRLGMEVMTPHHGDYYQGRSSPHDAGQPNPIVFLVVPAGSEFSFHLTCDTRRLPGHLVADWQTLMTAAFEHAFHWLGFGAKTAVGYGAMQIDHKAASEAAKARAERAAEAERARQENERKARLAALTPNLRRVEEFRERAEQRKNQLGNNKDKPNTQLHTLAQQLVKAALEDTSWTAEEKRALADAIEEWLPRLIERFDKKDDWKEARKKLKLATLRGES